MSEFIVSARKYRPQRFADVVGQDHISQTLKNALRSEKVAHAFLFCGPRGVGKTTNARILAKILNCTDRSPDYEACGKCPSCQAFDKNASFNIVELDAASNNSVEHIRTLVEQVRFAPQQGKYKVFIIDEVHMLSQAAFNAFLKTLEEPPPYAIFILATTEKHKIIPTILSRCQIFDFRRIQVNDIVKHLQTICAAENITAEPNALHIIAQKADGALRDALSIFDRIVSGSDNRTIRYSDVIENLNVLDYDYYFSITDALLTEDLPSVMRIFDEVMRKGFDADIFVGGLAEHFRNLLMCKDPQTLPLLEVGEQLTRRYQEQSLLADTTFTLTALNLCNDCDVNYKSARNKRLHVELFLIKMTHIGRAVEVFTTEKKNDLVKKIPADKRKTPAGTPDSESPVGSDVPTSTPEPTVALVENKNITATDIIVTDSLEKPKTEARKTPKTISDDLPPVVSEPSPGPAAMSTISNIPSGFILTPKIDSLDTIAQMIEEEEMILKGAVSKLSSENLVESWGKYAATHESPSTKSALKAAQLELVETKVIARVGSELAVGFIQNELRLPDFLRFDLNTPQLTLEIRFDASLAPEETKIQAPKKYLSPREKLKLMMGVNPLVKDLAFRLNLKPDE